MDVLFVVLIGTGIIVLLIGLGVSFHINTKIQEHEAKEPYDK